MPYKKLSQHYAKPLKQLSSKLLSASISLDLAAANLNSAVYQESSQQGDMHFFSDSRGDVRQFHSISRLVREKEPDRE